MSVLLQYETYAKGGDDFVFDEQTVAVGTRVLLISALTEAGRKTFDGPQKPNEDAYSVVRTGQALAAAVFDGTSSQLPVPELGETSGARFASHMLKEHLEATRTIPEAGDLLRRLNRMLRQTFAGMLPSVDYCDMNTVPASTATLVTLDAAADTVQTAHVTDSFAAVRYDDGRTELLTVNQHAAFDMVPLGTIARIAAELHTTHREAREDPRVKAAIIEMLQGVRNRPDGTGEGIVNGDPNMDRYVHTRTIALSGVRSILLGTDGIVPPGYSEERPADRERLFDIAEQDGLQALLAWTRAIEDTDADWLEPRFKHSDDATAVLIQR